MRSQDREKQKRQGAELRTTVIKKKVECKYEVMVCPQAGI